MSDTMLNYLAISILCLMALGCLASILLNSRGLILGRKRPFLWAIGTTALIVVSEITTTLFSATAFDNLFLNWAGNVLGFALTPLVFVFLALVYLRKDVPYRLLLFAPCAINALFCLLSAFGQGIFSLNAQNEYARGPFFAVFICAYSCGAAVFAGMIFHQARYYQCSVWKQMAALMGFFLIGTSVQVIFPEIHTTWCCATLAIVLEYALTLNFDAQLDPLTELYNRKAYEQALEALEKNRSYAVIMLDLDDFKQINDLYGHAFGDRCLRAVAQCLRAAFARCGSCYRYGGDEFCILCLHQNEGRIVQSLARMRDLLRAEQKIDPRLPDVSAGYAVRNEKDARGLREIVRAADAQMYREKQKKRTRRGIAE